MASDAGVEQYGGGVWFAGPFFRAVSIGVLAALPAAFIAGGIGSRVAMRIIGAVSDPCAGLITENENPCGELTLGGTIELLLFSTVFFAILGGVVYAAARPWLHDLGRWEGLVFGLLLFATFGSTVVEADNIDFTLFGATALNIALFALLFPFFGLLIAPVAARLDRLLPRLPPVVPVTAKSGLGYAAIAGASVVTLMFVPLIGVIPFEEGAVGVAYLYILAVVPLLALWVRRSRQRGAGTPVIAPLLALAPVVLGAIVTVKAIADIVS